MLVSGLAAPVYGAPRIGLWAEAEGVNQPFRSRQELDDFLRFTNNPGFTDIYCQVYRGGRSWYPSLAADDAPYRRAHAAGFDSLREVINAAHKRRQKVHAWLNVLRIQANNSLPMLRIVGEEALQVDSYGNSILAYGEDGEAPGGLGRNFRLETPGVWVDPSSKKVRQLVTETIRDLIVAYPDLDGIHLDMVRYPGTMGSGGGPRPDFGYSRGSIRSFYEFGGKNPPEPSVQLNSLLRSNAAWNAWRRAQVTLLVFEIRELLNEIAPELELSAAVISAPDRAYTELYQDWPEWIRGKVIDTAIPMNYSRDNDIVAQRTRFAAKFTRSGQVLVGLGAWMMKGSPQQLASQAKFALASGTQGVVLFSYSNLASDDGARLVTQFFSLLPG